MANEKKQEEIKFAEREESLRQRELEVSKLEQIKKELVKEYDNKKLDLIEQKKNILNEKDKEINAKNIELKKIEESISNANKNLSTINNEYIKLKAIIDTKINIYQNKQIQEINEKLTEKIKVDIKKIQEDYLEYLKKTTDTVEWSEKKLNQQFDKIIEEFQKMLETKEKLVQNKISDLEAAKKVYEVEIEASSHIHEEEAKQRLREKIINTKEKNLQKIIEQETAKQSQDIKQQLDNYKVLYESAIEEKNKIGLEYQKLLEQSKTSEAFEILDLQNQVEKLSKNNEELIKKYGKYASDEFEEIKVKAERYENVYNANIRLQTEIRELQYQLDTLNSEQENLEHLKYTNEILQNKIRVERLIAQELKNQIDELAARVDNIKSGVIAAETIERPYPQFENCEKLDKTSINEIEWIENIIANCKESGFEFSKRLFYSFHTALKTSDMSPLTVLAGVSGTGKSKLPQLYSRFGGIYFISVPVQPDWDSPQSLFGYFNSIEKRFNATSLLRALVSFQANKSKSETKQNILDLSNNVLLVLLDEMNLAHVELYFADLLSKLEELRGESKDIGFEVDLGAGNEKYEVILTDNVKWVGTMNEDETTKSLSDKVIDRGNVLSFPRPEKFERYNKKPLRPEQPKLNRDVWKKWVDCKIELSIEEAALFMGIVESINNALKKVNRALGHRVWQSIENYIISHPLVNEYKDDETRRGKALKYAFEEALVHKVMPKLRGIDTVGDQRENCLDVIKGVLSANELLSIIPDYENAMESVTETFIWDSAKYLSDNYKME